jgi:hypothetical protein
MDFVPSFGMPRLMAGGGRGLYQRESTWRLKFSYAGKGVPPDFGGQFKICLKLAAASRFTTDLRCNRFDMHFLGIRGLWKINDKNSVFQGCADLRRVGN